MALLLIHYDQKATLCAGIYRMQAEYFVEVFRFEFVIHSAPFTSERIEMKEFLSCKCKHQPDNQSRHVML